MVGVGGGGGNAVDHMINKGVQGVEFIAANTDAQALGRIAARTTSIQLGEYRPGRRLQAGSRPRSWPRNRARRIDDALRGAHMLFITAGMGGGTGTGAAPVVARSRQGAWAS